MANPPIHAARVGRWISENGQPVDLTADILSDLASSYDPALLQAPIVLGHPKAEDPAWGWIRDARFEAGSLWLTPERVVPELVELVQAGRYQAVSISVWPPNAEGNPKPGRYYLRHLGFLGAAVPAVNGLKPYAFASSADALVAVINLSSENSMSDKDKTALDEQRQQLDARHKELDARERQLRRTETLQFTQGLADKGQILPRHAEQLADVLVSLPGDAVISFADGSGKPATKPAGEVLRGIFSELPALPLGEKSKQAAKTAEESVQFSAPPGSDVPTEGLAKLAAIRAYQAEHKCSFETAMSAVGG